jgi:hypothetical protein
MGGGVDTHIRRYEDWPDFIAELIRDPGLASAGLSHRSPPAA